jgi:pSer/pThr/pTyr-binding forkhead associated (FHA) protein
MVTRAAELLFVSGPRKGERVPLIKNRVLVGRSPEAGVRVDDRHASREHFELTLTHDGWILENLSGHGTRINEKRFKSRKKKVLLGTGDTIGIGAKSQMLFVEAGDDADATLAAWQEMHAAPEPVETHAAPEPPAGTEPQPVSSEPSGPPLPPEESVETEPEEPDAPAEQKAAKTKIRRYALFGGIYLAGMVGFIILLTVMKDGREEGPASNGRTERLDEQKIQQVLSSVPDRNPIPTRAAQELREALSIYANLPSREGDLYRAVRSFQLYLAYRRDPVFQSIEDEKKYHRAREQLIEKVLTIYRNAWAFERAGHWEKSARQYERLVRIVPEKDDDSLVYRELVSNILERLTHVRSQLGRRQR